MAKQGRKRKIYHTRDGQVVPDFYLRSDGRFGTSLDRNKTFGRDETEAIRRYYEWRSKRKRVTVTVETPYEESVEARTKRPNEHKHIVPVMPSITSYANLLVEQRIDEVAFWRRVGELIRKNPEYAARMTGIKKLGYLDDLEPKPSLLPLKEIRDLYESKRFADPNESKRSLNYWDEFVEAVKPAKNIEEINNEALHHYHELMTDGRFKEKTIRNRYAKIGSILNYAWRIKKSHRASIDTLHTEFNIICIAGNRQESEPEPIEVEDFHALYNAANVTWKAILLCMLNFAMHPGECANLRKSDFRKGMKELSTTRTKTGVRRVAIVWQETVDAIKAYQATQKDNEKYQASDFLFFSEKDEPYSLRTGFSDHMRETLKPTAEKNIGRKLHCTLDHIRDGAQNAADEREADTIHTEFLMGHSIPKQMAAYKKRTPSKTQFAVECIREHYGITELVERNGETKSHSFK